MKRQGVELETLAGWENLQLAVWKAAKGKTGRPDVVCFIQNIDENLAELQEQILNGRLPPAAVPKFPDSRSKTS